VGGFHGLYRNRSEGVCYFSFGGDSLLVLLCFACAKTVDGRKLLMINRPLCNVGGVGRGKREDSFHIVGN
jgi:hypothetical protein